MTPVVNGRVLFNSYLEPDEYPIPGVTTIYDSSQKIDLDTIPLDGGFLIKTQVLSIDPYLRKQMSWPPRKHASPPFVIGEPISSFGVGTVIRSDHPEVEVGDHIYGVLDHVNYFIRQVLQVEDPETPDLQLLDNPYHLPLSTFVGVLGLPGKTAFFGWKEFAQPKKGQKVYISSGSGAVGSFLIQLAKLDGLKVIASAGSEPKVEYMKTMGADVAFDYKTTSIQEVLEREGPLDIYWDNVGGATLDAALEAAGVYARFIECGMISEYNAGDTISVKKLYNIITKSISMHGFTVTRLESKHGAEFQRAIHPLVASGQIQYKEEIYVGLVSVGDAILSVQRGTNNGKAVIHVA